VASTQLSARSALAGTVRLGRYGALSSGAPAVVLSERTGLAIAHVATRKGKIAEVIDWLGGVGGASPENAPRSVIGDHMVIVGCAPGQWFALSDGVGSSSAVARLTDALAGIASVIDHSAGKVVVRVTGPRARDVLAKGCPIDLDPRVFKPGSAASTEIAHIGCVIWQVDDQPTFDLMVNRSVAKSFWSWLAASAAAYGYEVVA
jgi:heterotetrameric sarcosine oxidase gamma subunit